MNDVDNAHYMGMDVDAYLSEKRHSIVQFLKKAEDDLDRAERRGHKETVATYTFLVQEYLVMLEEFDEEHGIQTI